MGTFLRRSSLDELPQVFNVLRGDMSLVGPRPAIPYEVAAYQTWHRRRVLEVKPGITGLWQVNGRCRLSFDEMVRLDLRYAKTWSPWFDLKILLRTPRAVVVRRRRTLKNSAESSPGACHVTPTGLTTAAAASQTV